jgi:group I intron endonuclease
METIYKESSKKSGIYKISNKVNGKIYIGSAKEFKRRFSQHHCSLKKGTHHNKHLQAAWNQHGESAFVFEVIEVTTGSTEERRLIEEGYLQKLMTDGLWETCYNKTPETTKRDNSRHVVKERKGKTYEEIFGKEKALAMKEARIRRMKERWASGEFVDYDFKVQTEEHRRKQSLRNSGKGNPFYGKKHTKETRQRISEAQSGKTYEERFGTEKAVIIKAKKAAKQKEYMDAHPELKQKTGAMNRGKTHEEMYGAEKAKLVREKTVAARQKTYKDILLISPSGLEIAEITNASLFARENGIQPHTLLRLIQGKIKKSKCGWRSMVSA